MSNKERDDNSREKSDLNLKEESGESKYIASLSKKGITIDFSREDIEKHLPHLAAELNDTNNSGNKDINDIYNAAGIENINPAIKLDNSSMNEMDEEKFNKSLKIQKEKMMNLKSNYDEDSELYNPKTTDFLQRCTTIQEAEEILSYQLKIGEIDKEEADTLLKTCKEKGLEYFGPTKTSGYYDRTYHKRY